MKTTPGCVFSWYKPTYEINEKKFPAAAAHIWLVQHQLPGHYGLQSVGEPLTYLGGDVLVPGGNQAISDYNRNVMCPDSWAQNEPVTLSPELSSKNDDQPSCDEFPFAASYESAAMPKTWGGKNSSPVTSGDQRVNTRAIKGSDGKWRMVLNPNYPLPTWTESCGRAAMSLNQNSQSMSLFPTFRRDNRVVDGDEYWLKADKPS